MQTNYSPPILHIASQGRARLSSNYWILGLVHMFLIPYPFPHPFFIIRARHAILLVKVLDIRSCKQVSFPQPSFSPPAKYLTIRFSMLKSDIRSCKHITMLTHPPILHITSQGLACLSSNYWILGLVHMFLIPYPSPNPFFI